MLLFSFTMIGCSSSAAFQYADNNSDKVMIKKIDQQYQVWKKTPYRYGGTTLKGIDCSAFTMNFYRQKNNITLPRVTSSQAKIGQSVTKLQAGDLVFFKTGHGETGLHVGIYYKNGRFLHISPSKGVQFANLNNQYWKKHYWLARRVIS